MTRPAASAVLVVVLLALLLPRPAAGEDRWFAADKTRHFGAGAGIAAGGYAAAVPLTRRKRWRIVLGTTAGVGAAAGKELRDRRRGDPSWRDFTWSAAGAAAGVVVAWIIDSATD
jgi:uncharacterized protein YfiM (DUF2279 family)